MRSGIIVAFLWVCMFGFTGITSTHGKPLEEYPSGQEILEKTSDVLSGKRKLNVEFSSDGIKTSVGPSDEEIAFFIALCIGILLIGLCCCCCCKYICCDNRRQPTTIIYHQMSQPQTQPGPVNTAVTMPSNAVQMLAMPVQQSAVAFEPLPNVEELTKRQQHQPPAYSAENCTTSIRL